METIAGRDRRQIVLALAATWRAHSCSGTGLFLPGAFTITEDDDKFTFEMNPCGSGQRLVRMGRYEGPNALGVTHAAHDWSYAREGFPLYYALLVHERVAPDPMDRLSAVSKRAAG